MSCSRTQQQLLLLLFFAHCCGVLDGMEIFLCWPVHLLLAGDQADWWEQAASAAGVGWRAGGRAYCYCGCG